jgi:hypothetical protein
MASPFDRLEMLGRAFYEGWKWSVNNHYTNEDWEAFVNEVAEPMNCEVIKLINQGYSMSRIDKILESARLDVWPEMMKKEIRNGCIKKTT